MKISRKPAYGKMDVLKEKIVDGILVQKIDLYVYKNGYSMWNGTSRLIAWKTSNEFHGYFTTCKEAIAAVKKFNKYAK